MILKDFIAGLNQLITEHPEALDMDVISSRDDEGNGFNIVYFAPCRGVFQQGDFIVEDQLDEWDMTEDQINAVCIN